MTDRQQMLRDMSAEYYKKHREEILQKRKEKYIPTGKPVGRPANAKSITKIIKTRNQFLSEEEKTLKREYLKKYKKDKPVEKNLDNTSLLKIKNEFLNEEEIARKRELLRKYKESRRRAVDRFHLRAKLEGNAE